MNFKNKFLGLVLSLFFVGLQNTQAQPLSCESLLENHSPYVLDLANEKYFHFLVEQNKSNKTAESILIYDPSVDQKGARVVYPTAVAPESLNKKVPVQSYKKLLASKNIDELYSSAKQANLYIAKMQAGTGSSISRAAYLSRMKNIELSKVKLGAKGTDLYIPQFSQVHPVSIAEAQILQSAAAQSKSVYKSIHWIDLVSPETDAAIKAIWQSSQNGELKHIQREDPIFQFNVPTVDVEGQLTINRMAPAGHGFFAYQALQKIASEPTSKNLDKIVVIANGEDLSGTPDPAIVGYMKKNKIPILMITTDKTEIDLKGGQIALATENDGSAYITIVEHAQAEASQQKKLFENLGLRPQDRKALFNTNMVLLNFEVLSPLLKTEISKIGETEFFQKIGPNLIKNWKAQVDKDGVERKYLQLEGAMGSMILNLDRYFRKEHKTPLVSFVNIEREYRTQFFAPIKTAFDYYMQFYSDRFSYDMKSHRLVDHRPGFLPAIKLLDSESKDKYYADVDHVIETFKGAKILKLDELTLEGRFELAGIELKGQVQILNKTNQVVNLAEYLKRNSAVAEMQNGYWVVENKVIVIE